MVVGADLIRLLDLALLRVSDNADIHSGIDHGIESVHQLLPFFADIGVTLAVPKRFDALLVVFLQDRLNTHRFSEVRGVQNKRPADARILCDLIDHSDQLRPGGRLFDPADIHLSGTAFDVQE